MVYPVFATSILEWNDKMVHRDINGIPWMWIEVAGIDENGVYSEWVGIFDSK